MSPQTPPLPEVPTRRAVFAAGAALLLLLAAPAAQAAPDVVNLKVSVIHATKTAGEPDPALDKIREDLQQAFAGYTRFKRLQHEELKLKVGQGATIALPNGEQARFDYKGMQEKLHQIRLSLPATKVELDLRAPARKLFYQAGIKHQDGILILAMFLE